MVDGRSSPPLSFDVPSMVLRKVQTSLYPRTSGYFIAESSVVGLFGTYLAVSSDVSLVLPAVAFFIIMISYPLYRWLRLSDTAARQEHSMWAIPSRQLLGYLGIGYAIFFGGPKLGVFPASVGVFFATLFTGYGLIILHRRGAYRDGTEVFVCDDPSRDLWVRAGRALERSEEALSNGNRFLAYHWGKYAQELYTEIQSGADRPIFQQVSRLLSDSGSLLAEFSYVDETEAVRRQQEVESIYEEVATLLSKRVCDSCGHIKDVSNVTRIVDEDSEGIFCEECMGGRRDRQDEVGNQQRGRENPDSGGVGESESREDKGSRKEESSENRDSGQRSSQSEAATRVQQSNLSVEEAADVLGISLPVSNESEVKSAFREKSKESHPDAGGSEIEFKLAKESREVLIDSIEQE